MKVSRSAGKVTIELGGDEERLLCRALERATFQDTPPGEQQRIMELALHLLKLLEQPAE